MMMSNWFPGTTGNHLEPEPIERTGTPVPGSLLYRGTSTGTGLTLEPQPP